MQIKRIFFVDPNLLKNLGHVIESASAVKNYLAFNKNIQPFMITNVNADSSLSQVLGVFYPAITNTCFMALENNGEVFCNDLKNLHRKFNFTHKDLIVIPTCFTNEVSGSSKFLQRTGLSVRIVLMIHQWLAPAQEFSMTLEGEYQKKCELLLKKSLKEVEYIDLISVWTTESLKLNRFINSLSEYRIGKLPLPINFYPKLLDHSGYNTHIKIAFLGDGRYEKGLFLFMDAIRKFSSSRSRFVIQDIGARGYSYQQYQSFLKLKVLLSASNRVCFINTPLDPYRFQEEVSKADILAFPYHPLSYDRRISEVYIQSIMYHKLTVVSNSTWLGEEANKFSSGVTFDYDCKDLRRTAENLREALLIAAKNKNQFAGKIVEQAKVYRELNTSECFFKRILEYYNLK